MTAGTRDAAAEFEQYEANPTAVEPTTPTPTPVEGLAPLLTLARVVPQVRTIKVFDTIHKLLLLTELSVGQQVYLVNCYNVTLQLRTREAQGETLADDEREQRRFLLNEISRGAIPSLSAEDRDALSDEQIEAITNLFFTESQAERDRSNPVYRPTSPA